MRLKLWLRSDKLEALHLDTWAALGLAAVPAVGQSVHLCVRLMWTRVFREVNIAEWFTQGDLIITDLMHRPVLVIPIWCTSFHPSIRREVITIFYLFTRDLKNLVLKVLCYHFLTSELIPLNSSCLVTPCLCIGFTESASTVILCCSQHSYGYFNCRPQLAAVSGSQQEIHGAISTTN